MSVRNLRKDLESLTPDQLRIVEKFVARLEKESSSKPKATTAPKRRLARK